MIGSQLCAQKGRDPKECDYENSGNFLKSFTPPLPPPSPRPKERGNLQAGGEEAETGTEGEQAGRGRPQSWGLKEGRGPPGHSAGPVGCRRHVPSGSFSALGPPCPLAGEKRNYVGTQGISSRPQGPAACQPWSSLPGSHLGPEKYWRLWLTELFFRFEPAPHFDSNPAGKGKRFSGSARRAQGAGGAVRCWDRLGALPSAPRGVKGGWDWGALAASLSRDGGVALPSPLAVENRARLGPQSTSFRHQNRTRKMLGKNLLFPNERHNRRDGKSWSCGTSLHEVNSSACFYSKFPGAWAW